MKQEVKHLKEEMDKPTIIIEYFGTLWLAINKREIDRIH